MMKTPPFQAFEPSPPVRGNSFQGTFALAVLGLMMLLCGSCSKPASRSGPGDPRAARPVPVTVAKATTSNVPLELEAIGNVEAYSTVTVRPQITGQITAVHFHEGADVKAGQLLFSIDPRPEEAALRSARADVERDQAQLVSARLDFERTQKLFENSIASQDAYDKAQAALQALKATVAADKAAVSNAAVNLGYTTIRSPINGRTGDLMVKAGNVVKAPDDALVTINQLHPIYVTFSVPEQNLPQIRARMKAAPLSVQVEIPNDAARPKGKLTFVDNAVDPNTGTIKLKATCPNLNDDLWPGQFVQVSLVLSVLTNAVVVPTQAIQTGQNGEFIYVVRPDQTVEARPVKIGIDTDGQTVVRHGLQPGETVVTDGQLRLEPGSKVAVKSPRETKPTASVNHHPT